MATNLKTFKCQLESEIKNASKVFIVGHNSPDFDSIGSAMGLYALAKHFGKDAYIIIDDQVTMIESGVLRILNESDNVFIINKEDFLNTVDQSSILIVTDVNKKHMISIGDSLDKFKSVLIVDHHNEDSDTISTDKKYININVSSASEVVAKLLSDFKIRYDTNIANYLLAGINLDTKRFKTNTTQQTHDIARRLLAHGANIDYVNNLFLEEFESYARISSLIINGTVIKKFSESLAPIQVSFTINRNNPKTIYLKEDYAKAADKMMKFIGIDAAFALGYVDPETIHISARGGKKVNVGKIMAEMQGGGNNQSAGARIKSDNIFEVEQALIDKISVGLSSGEDIIDTPQIIKVKRAKNN